MVPMIGDDSDTDQTQDSDIEFTDDNLTIEEYLVLLKVLEDLKQYHIEQKKKAIKSKKEKILKPICEEKNDG